MLYKEMWTALWCEKREKLRNAICGKSLSFCESNKCGMDINAGGDILGVCVQKYLHNMYLILNG